MKKFFALLAAILLTASVFLPRQASAQSPESMSYQAVIRDASDRLVKDTEVGVRIKIQVYIPALPPGDPSYIDLYVETHTISTNENGLLTLMIGEGTTVSGTFADINQKADILS